MAMSAFRRNTKAEQKTGGGKGMRGNWREQMRLPKAQPAPFILIRGEYNDPNPAQDMVEVDPKTNQIIPSQIAYYKWLKHRLKTIGQGGKERFIDDPCARGWDKHNPQACAGCMAMDAGDKRITLSETYSMGLVHLAVYHRHPLVDYKTGQLVMSKKDNQSVMVESECTGKTCNFCRVLAGQQPVVQANEFWPNYPANVITNVFGSRRYMELGSGHLGDVGEWDKQVGSRCGGISWVKDAQGQYVRDAQGNAIPKGRCNSFLDVDGYACSVCGNMLIDAEADPRPLEELEKVALKKYPCHVCQRPVFLKEMNSCPVCQNAVVQGIFDGVCWGQRQGEGTNSHLVLVQFDSIEDFEASLHPSIRALFQGKTLRQRIEELAKPYDFSGLYKPKTFEEQAKRLEINIQQQGMPMGMQQPMAGPPTFYGVPGQAPQQQMMQPPQGAPQYPGPVPQQAQQPVQPQYQSYTSPTSPGPAPFTPPAKPNFGN